MTTSPAELIRRFADQIEQMKKRGETWDQVAAMLAGETGETLSVPVLRATYSRVAASAKRSPAASAQADKPKPKPLENEKVVEIEGVENLDDSTADVPNFDDHLDDETDETEAPALYKNGQLVRLIGHRVRLMGWTDFIQQEDLLDRLKNRHQNLNFSRLSDLLPDAPFCHILTSWTKAEFGRHLAEKIDVQKFWKDRAGGEIEARENRVCEHYKTDRRKLFIQLVAALIDDDQGYANWLLYLDGRGYHNTVQKIDNEVIAGRGSDNVNAVINRVRQGVKSAYTDHLKCGRAA